MTSTINKTIGPNGEVTYSDGTGSNTTDTKSPAQRDAERNKEIEARKKEVKKQDEKRNANSPKVNPELPNTNTKGEITTVSPPGKTPEKLTLIEKFQKQIENAQDVLTEKLGLKEGTDKLGAGQAAKDGIGSARAGGYKIEIGATGKVTAPIPGVDPIKIGKPDNVYSIKDGVPCDTDAGEIGVGSSYLSKWLSKLKYAKKAEKLGTKVEVNVGVSVKADAACINSEKVLKGVPGAVVHGIENSDAGRNSNWEVQDAKRQAQIEAAGG